jgi:hydroxypyruvate reductase
VTPETAADALDAHDAYPLLDGAGALLRTGPTGTNVNDLRAVVVAERGARSDGGGARPEERGGGSEGTK